jgi:tetratricopeptide (TPR) repeat protein
MRRNSIVNSGYKFSQTSRFKLTAALLLLMALSACQPTAPVLVIAVPEPEPIVEDTSLADIAAAERAFEEQLRYQRMIADILYEGIKALHANRLLTPPDISAYAYFNRVLATEPDNAAAQQGIQDIVLKYLQLADAAGRQGQFDSARSYLRRAEQVDRNHPGILPAWATLEAEMKSSDVIHSLSARDLASQSAQLLEQLTQIAVQLRDSGAFFLITAPNDAQARWIYAQMQAAVEGHRLRGNIELGDTPTIRLIMPNDGDA